MYVILNYSKYKVSKKIMKFPRKNNFEKHVALKKLVHQNCLCLTSLWHVLKIHLLFFKGSSWICWRWMLLHKPFSRSWGVYPVRDQRRSAHLKCLSAPIRQRLTGGSSLVAEFPAVERMRLEDNKVSEVKLYTLIRQHYRNSIYVTAPLLCTFPWFSFCLFIQYV